MLLIIAIFIAILGLIVFPISAFIYFISYIVMNSVNPYIRNKKAKDINLKLEGLKKYIKEYSMLEQREQKELMLWKDYLIYSVIWGQNTKIVEEVMKKI